MHPQHSPLAFSPDNYSIIQKTPKGKKGDRQKRGKKGDRFIIDPFGRGHRDIFAD